MNLSRSEIQIPLSSSVALSNMVVFLLAFVTLSVAMSISILFGYTSIYGWTVASCISFFFASFCVVAYSSINFCSTPFFSFESWICTGSIGVILKFPYSFEL